MSSPRIVTEIVADTPVSDICLAGKKGLALF
jgi:hypothetical protein